MLFTDSLGISLMHFTFTKTHYFWILFSKLKWTRSYCYILLMWKGDVVDYWIDALCLFCSYVNGYCIGAHSDQIYCVTIWWLMLLDRNYSIWRQKQHTYNFWKLDAFLLKILMHLCWGLTAHLDCMQKLKLFSLRWENMASIQVYVFTPSSYFSFLPLVCIFSLSRIFLL